MLTNFGIGPLVLAELLPQLLLRLHQYLLARGGQIFAAAIDVEGEHGERGAEWIGLAAIASLRRALQRGGDPPGILRGKDPALERESVAVLGHLLRPAPSACGCCAQGGARFPASNAR